MKSSEIFGIIVRTIGLILLVTTGFWIIPALFSLVLGGPPVGWLIPIAVPMILIGLWLLRGGKAVIAFAFPEDKQNY
jgi:hypothetical protein